MHSADIVRSLHQTLALWETELGGYSLKQLRRKPDKDSWSLGQVYVHLLDETASYNFRQIEECISGNENADGQKSEEGVAIYQ